MVVSNKPCSMTVIKAQSPTSANRNAVPSKPIKPRSKIYWQFAWWLGIAGLASVLIPLIVFIYRFAGSPASGDPDDWGVFGDYIGGFAGTIVSLIALVLLAINLHLQAKELEASRKELKSTRKEMYKQRGVLNRQVFDATFFQLLGQFRAVAENVVIEVDKNPLRGREAFEKLATELKGKYSPFNFYPTQRPSTSEEDLRYVQGYYREIYEREEPELGPYFRMLFHVFRSIMDDESLTDSDKIRYAKIARAQLSKYELALLFYNGLWGEGREFVPLIQHFGILRHVSKKSLMHEDHFDNRDFYAVGAFQSVEDRTKKLAHASVVNARPAQT